MGKPALAPPPGSELSTGSYILAPHQQSDCLLLVPHREDLVMLRGSLSSLVIWGLQETGEKEQEEVKQEKEEEEQEKEKRERRQIRERKKGRERAGQKDGLSGTCPVESLSLMSVCKMSLFLARVTDTWEVVPSRPFRLGTPVLGRTSCSFQTGTITPKARVGQCFFFFPLGLSSTGRESYSLFLASY